MQAFISKNIPDLEEAIGQAYKKVAGPDSEVPYLADDPLPRTAYNILQYALKREEDLQAHRGERPLSEGAEWIGGEIGAEKDYQRPEGNFQHLVRVGTHTALKILLKEQMSHHTRVYPGIVPCITLKNVSISLHNHEPDGAFDAVWQNIENIITSEAQNLADTKARDDREREESKKRGEMFDY